MKLRAAAICAFIGLLSSSPERAQAYCLTSTCSECPRDQETGCTLGGTPVRWPAQCVSFSMQQRGSALVTTEQATSMMREAFAIWEGARCSDSGDKPAIRISHAFGPAVCDQAEYNGGAGNANLVIFRDDEWPYSEQAHELAATWLTVDRSGSIVDADIEINATAPLHVPADDEQLELGVIANQRDLLSIMVHEAGHFLGIDHSLEEGAVMRAALEVGEVRTALSPDDVAAICAAYPPAPEPESCDFSPHNGFASECGPALEPGGCSVGRRSRAGARSLWALALAGAVLSRLRRGRRR